MTKSFAALALVMVLGGCGSADDISLSNASVTEVAEKVKGAQKQLPGEWETAMKLTEVDMTGTPGGDQVAAMMKSQLGKEQKQTACLTKEEAEKPAFTQAAGVAENCRFKTFTMKDGKIDSTLTCKAPDGPGTMEIRQAGTFSDKTFDLTSTISQFDPAGKPKGKMTMVVNGKRTGDCKTKS